LSSGIANDVSSAIIRIDNGLVTPLSETDEKRFRPSYMRKKGWPSRWKNKPNGLVVEGCLDNWDKIDVPLYKRTSFVLTLEIEKKCRSSYWIATFCDGQASGYSIRASITILFSLSLIGHGALLARFVSLHSFRNRKSGFAELLAVGSVVALLLNLFSVNDFSGPPLNRFPSTPPSMSTGTRGSHLETDHFNLSFEGNIDNMVDVEGETLERIFQGATEFLDFIFPGKTRVNISTDPDILPPETIDLGFWGYVMPSRESQSGEPEMFLSLSPEWAVQSNDNSLDMREWIATHEFIHVVRDHQTRDHNGSLYPPWLREGLPTYYAFQHLSASDVYVRWWIWTLLENDELTDIDDLFNYDHIALGEGYTVIKYIIDEYGRQGFLDFLKAFEGWDGTKTTRDNMEIVFSTVFGRTVDEFNDDWKEFLSEDFAVGYDWEEIEKVPGEVLIDSPGWDMPTSAKNGKLLWVSDQHGSLDIFLSNEDGSGQKRLTSEAGYDGDAKLDYNATWVAFTSTRNGAYDVYKMTIDGKNLTQLTDDGFVNVMGSWSPDEEEIAFTSNRNGEWDIFVMESDGSNIRELVATEANEGSPAFSPDGSKLAFVSDAAGLYDLYVSDSDGSNPQQLTSTRENVSFPSWSPDGKRIAYTLKREFARKLCVIDVGSGFVEILYEHPSHAGFGGSETGVLRFPVWSSDADTVLVAFFGQIRSLELPSEAEAGVLWIVVSVVIAVVGVAMLIPILWKRKKRSS